MLIARVIFHLFVRFCWLALWGLAYGFWYGFVCGAVSGSILGFFVGLASRNSGVGLRVFEGTIFGGVAGAGWAIVIAMPTCIFVFGIAGMLTAKRRFLSDDELRKQLSRGAFWGSALGTLCGMTLVPCAAWLADFAWRSLSKQPLINDWILVYMGGVILFFVIGIIISALCVVYEWKTPEWLRLKR